MKEIMSDIPDKTKVFSPVYRDEKKAHIPNIQAYNEMYAKSIKDTEGFWAEQAERLDWYKKWTKVSNNNLSKETPSLDSISNAVLFMPSFAILMLCLSASFGDILRLFKLLLNS